MMAYAIQAFPELPRGSRAAERHLENGLQVLAVEVPTARKVRLVAGVGVGYLDEPVAWPGLAHLLEHALFLGSLGYPRPGEFATWVGEQGGRYNAKTDEYVTDYHLSLPPGAARAGLFRLVDLLARPCLDRQAIDREVDVIDAEFKARLADPALHRQAVLSRLFESTHSAYRFHAGHRTSLGSDSAALRQQLNAFHDAHYRAERICLVMLGPMPLANQLKILEEAGGDIPGGAQSVSHRFEKPWRWSAPAHLQWRLPDNLPSRAPTLELLWPLPASWEESYPGWRERLVVLLCDGRLTATLQQRGAISDLAATTQPEAAGSALSLKLVMTEAGTRCVESLIATCQAAVKDSIARLASGEWPHFPTTEANLDLWPLEKARQLAQKASRSPQDSAPASDESRRTLDELAVYLAPSACRVVEEIAEHGGYRHFTPETSTPFRWREPVAQEEQPQRLASCAPPLITTRPEQLASRIDHWPGIAQRLDRDESLQLWWGGGPVGNDASWCLGWPAPQAARDERLLAWRQATLALRQAAWSQGVELTLGSDAQGDWLMARGAADRLESALSQGLAAWPTRAIATRPEASDGLLAQRLLAHLEVPSATGDPQATGHDILLLNWLSGSLSIDEAHPGCLRLQRQAAALIDTTQRDVAPAPPQALGDGLRVTTQWLTPQGSDYTLMLQVDGPEDSPRSRLAMWLLAQCHDAAFFHELRQCRGLGYIAAVRYREAGKLPRLGYVVQSPHADIATLQKAVNEFLVTQGVALANLDEATLSRRRESLRAIWGPPETPSEAIAACWQALREHVLGASASRPGSHQLSLCPWEEMEAAIDALTHETLQAYAEALVDGRLPRRWWKHAPDER